MKTFGFSLAILVSLLTTALPVYAQDQPAKAPSQWADDYHLTLPKVITVLVGVLAGGTLLYVIGEQVFVETVIDTSVGSGQAVVAGDMTEHSGIVTAMTIFGGTMGGIFSGIGYDHYAADVQQAIADIILAAQNSLTAGAALFQWHR
jgi:hypothetical protein